MASFLRVAVGFYVLSILLGLVLRASFLWPVPGLVFTHALHAHSHTLYFGWAGLAVSALWFHQLGALSRAHRRALWALVALSAATFVAFLHSGYGAPGMAVSGAGILVWGALAWMLWSASRRAPGLGGSFLRVGTGYLVFALCGAVARVVVLAARVEDPVWGRLAVFAFVHNFAWFLVFALIGLLRASAPALGLRFHDGRLRWQLGAMAALAWTTFPLGVIGADGGVIGGIARVGALLLVVPGLVWAHHLWRAGSGSHVRGAVRFIALWSALHALGALAGAAGLSPLAVMARHPVVLYLHVLLVGVVTSLLLLLVSHLLQARLPSPLLHHGGLLVMSLGLGLASAPGFLPLPPELIRHGLLLAFVGAAMLVSAAVVFGTREVLRTPEGRIRVPAR